MIFLTLKLREEKNTTHIFEGSGVNFITQQDRNKYLFCATKKVCGKVSLVSS